MNYDRKKYEQLILESPLFGLDREAKYTAFKRESYRMVEYLYCYLLSINEKEYMQKVIANNIQGHCRIEIEKIN